MGKPRRIISAARGYRCWENVIIDTRTLCSGGLLLLLSQNERNQHGRERQQEKVSVSKRKEKILRGQNVL